MASEVGDGVPRVPKAVSKYSSAKEAKKKKGGTGPEAVGLETLMREMAAQVSALQAQASLAEERAAEYRRQTGALREQKRAAEERAERLAGELQTARAGLEQLQAAHRAALGRLGEAEEGKKSAESEREALRERGRVATVAGRAEQGRLQEQLAQAEAGVAAMGAELAAADKKAAELAERLEASRRECEGLRARAAEPGELEVTIQLLLLWFFVVSLCMLISPDNLS
jgi:DNA repair exonuclease SbcCD ATPase subunit